MTKNVHKITRDAEYDGSFPDAKVGDLLYSGTLLGGFATSVIVAKDGNSCLVIDSEWDLVCPPQARIGSIYLHRSLAEAIKADVDEDIEYHSKSLRLAREAIAAVEAGEDLARFVDGVGDET